MNPPLPPPAMETRREIFSHDGRDRGLLVMRPEVTDGSLLIGLHGATQRGSIMARTTGFGELPGTRRMVLLFPDAVDGIWRDGRGTDDDVDDVGFVEALLDHFIATQEIDPRQVFLVGASNGGFLSQRLACELEGRFRAVATVIATMGLRVFQQCYPAEAPSLYLVAGTADPIIPYEGGATPNSLMHSADAPILGFDDLVAHWQGIGGFNRCRSASRTVAALGGDTLTIHEMDCRGDNDHRLRAVTVDGGGHQWYGREVGNETIRRFGATTTQFRLSEEILEFFATCRDGPDDAPGGAPQGWALR